MAKKCGTLLMDVPQEQYHWFYTFYVIIQNYHNQTIWCNDHFNVVTLNFKGNHTNCRLDCEQPKNHCKFFINFVKEKKIRFLDQTDFLVYILLVLTKNSVRQVLHQEPKMHLLWGTPFTWAYNTYTQKTT